jgi:phage tail sheath protein FI
MPVVPTYPGVYIEELPSSEHTITQAPTSITVFVGYVHPFQGAAADPTKPRFGEAIRIFQFDDYVNNFGPLYNNHSLNTSDVGYAVKQFFLNGGSDAYVVGLKPWYYDTSTTNRQPREEITPGYKDLSGIRFTATQLTDTLNSIRIMISNVRKTTNPNDTADILISYGSLLQPEPYRGVQLDSTSPAFIEKRLKGSNLVKVGPAPGGYPNAFTTSSSPQLAEIDYMPDPTFLSLTPPHQPTVFSEGDFDAVFQADTSLDKVDVFNLLVIPGVSDTEVWSQALAFCERKLAFFIMDAPARYVADQGASGLQTIEDFARSALMPASTHAALYFPYLKTPDPVTSKSIAIPPSGSVAGIYARTDTQRGIWKAPAGLETTINNTTGVVDEGRMTDLRQGTVNDLGVNVLRSFSGARPVVWGARTTATKLDPSWRYVPVRRMALFLEQTLLRNLTWVVFEPNDVPLWTAIRISIEAFMLSYFRQGAFQGTTPSQAFLVRCDETTTTPQDVANGIVNILVGFAPLKPAEFVIIQIAQLAGQTQA